MGAEYDFTLVLTGISELTQEIEDSFFEAGCDDATLSSRSGRVYATFSRRGASLKAAILSAVSDVRKAGADVLRVDVCSLVTQADIARKIDRTRQLVHQYVTGRRGPGNFPPPACHMTEGTPLWFWCEVAQWLWENNMIREDQFREAEEVDVINTVLELAHNRQNNPALTTEVLESVGSSVCCPSD